MPSHAVIDTPGSSLPKSQHYHSWPTSRLIGASSDSRLLQTCAIVLASLGLAYALSTLLLSRRPSSHRRVYSVHPLCPAFVSGLYAAYQLGANETAFLLSLHAQYGDIVYIPSPLRQHFILSDELVRQIYNGSYNKQLSFIPIRKQMSGSVFGMSRPTWQASFMEKRIFPAHARAMVRGKLGNAIQRFESVVQDSLRSEVERLEKVPTSSGAQTTQKPLVKWVYDIVFRASVAGLFGFEHGISPERCLANFHAFDDAFPLLASGMVPEVVQPYFPPTVASGIRAQKEINQLLGTWARDAGCVGLEKGDVVKDMTAEAVALGLSVDDIGAMAAGDFWALLANAPFAMAWCLLYVLQADRQLLRDILAEIDAAYASAQDPGQGQVSTSQMDVPLLTSCFYETLRLQSSSFSVREASQQAVLGDTVIEKGESVVCITRAGHLDTAVWGDDAQLWDGRRFYDDPATAGQNLLPDEQRGAKCIPHVRAFGGGVSIVSDEHCIAPERNISEMLMQAIKYSAKAGPWPCRKRKPSSSPSSGLSPWRFRQKR